MKIADLFQGISYELLHGSTNTLITDHCIDSRTVSKGALFICLRGLNADGHEYIMKAAQAGASAILVEDKTALDDYLRNAPPSETTPTLLYVENTRRAMGLIAANAHQHPARHLRLIGVTGTNGKTTVTHFIENILRSAGRKTGLIGTAGVQVNGETLPITFATATTPDPLELHAIFAKLHELGVQDVVMEVSSHALALHKMEGLTFDVGVFTNLTQDHLDFHGTMQNYHDAKALLFKISRAAVVNADDANTPTMLKFFTGNPCVTYSLQAEADLRAQHIKSTPQGMTFDVETNGTHEYFTLPVLGRFNVYNCLAAIGVAQLLGIHSLQPHVAKIARVRGRFEVVPNDRGVLVIVDYAHTPDGLENSLNSLREIVPAPGRIVTLFGCGGDRDADKRPKMGVIAGQLSDYVILTSDNPRTENPHTILAQIEEGTKTTPVLYEIHENRRDAIRRAIALLKKDDALIIAGKGHEDYQIIGTTKHPFDDVQVAQAFLA